MAIDPIVRVFSKKNTYKLRTRVKRADRGFFRPRSNELVLRKAAYRSPTLKKKRGEREREIKEKRTNKSKRKRETQFVSYYGERSLFRMAIRKCSKSRVAKDYRLLEIKVDLFIIPWNEPHWNKYTTAHGIRIKYNKDNKRARYFLKPSFGCELGGSPSTNQFFFF